MADNRLTRQQIYDRIRESSKEEYILEDMKRLGFWQRNEEGPSVPELLIKRESTLNKELNSLLAEKRKYQNKEAVLKEMRMKRMAEAKQKREENKKKREQQRYEKAQAWRAKRETEIFFLGEGVSAGLHYTESNLEELQKKALPVFENEMQLANAMGIALKELSFLSYSRRVSAVSHYQKFYLPKKSSGKRLISAPMPRLKKAQHWILQHILYKVPVHAQANGFVPGKSIVSNATPHIGKNVVVNADVKDFFPSITFKRVKALFGKLGYADKIATILSLLCTESVTEEVMLDGKKYFVQKGERVLPQGAPTSPAVTNILCFRLDKRLSGVAKKFGCGYTRYADDITFSGTLNNSDASKIVWHIKKILSEEGLTIHPDKIRVMQKSERQEVTGVVVNRQLSVSREKLRNFRALLHQLKKNGHENAKWSEGSLSNAIAGYASFIRMVNPAKAEKFIKEISDIRQSQTWQHLLLSEAAAIAKKLNQQTLPSTPAPPPANNNRKEDGEWYNVV
ncbi:MAG: RNA-directed DNA polymerase [Chitinophagaceae bacterium]|nr:RNA-directed DNA polymerase [Chitinophagaceae bacterium]